MKCAGRLQINRLQLSTASILNQTDRQATSQRTDRGEGKGRTSERGVWAVSEEGLVGLTHTLCALLGKEKRARRERTERNGTALAFVFREMSLG